MVDVIVQQTVIEVTEPQTKILQGPRGIDSILKGDVEALSQNDLEKEITFLEPVTVADYLVHLQLVNVTDVEPSFYSMLVTAKSAAGFTVKFSEAIDSANYELQWHITEMPGA